MEIGKKIDMTQTADERADKCMELFKAIRSLLNGFTRVEIIGTLELLKFKVFEAGREEI